MSGPISGTWFVCPTPFDDDGAVDVGSIGTLAEAAIDWGVDGLTVLGVMGEATSLTDAERDTVQEAFVSAAAGRVPRRCRLLVAVGHRDGCPHRLRRQGGRRGGHGVGSRRWPRTPIRSGRSSAPPPAMRRFR